MPVAPSEQEPFWRALTLEEMSPQEWESLCDGCGKCCLHKLEDEDSGEVEYTNVACRLLDLKTVRCSRYAERQRFVPDCAVLTPERARTFSWLPESCAYRRVAEGKDLPDWHPLVSGYADSARLAGATIKNWCVSERDAGDLEDHIIEGEGPACRSGDTPKS